MNRRDLLVAAGGAVAVSALGGLERYAQAETGHEHHMANNKNDALMATSAECITSANACLTHCIDTLGTGDKSLYNCAKSVRELVWACDALLQAASGDSKYLKQMALVSADICRACEKECSKHKKHQTCLDCAEACRKCLKECEKLGA
jgi:Cys-rich four helix bundle protein (predicted Tat secretion target)